MRRELSCLHQLQGAIPTFTEYHQVLLLPPGPLDPYSCRAQTHPSYEEHPTLLLAHQLFILLLMGCVDGLGLGSDVCAQLRAQAEALTGQRFLLLWRHSHGLWLEAGMGTEAHEGRRMDAV